jgi:hypothetical protein
MCDDEEDLMRPHTSYHVQSLPFAGFFRHTEHRKLQAHTQSRAIICSAAATGLVPAGAPAAAANPDVPTAISTA